jgi:hypothetical protein
MDDYLLNYGLLMLDHVLTISPPLIAAIAEVEIAAATAGT